MQSWTNAEKIAKTDNMQCDALSNLEAEGGTNLAAGIQLARNLLGMDDVKNIANKNIVVLTDGEPTCGIGKGTEDGTDAVCRNGNNMIGTGSTLLGNDGKLYPWNNPDYHKIHVKAESIAQSLGSSGITPYAVFVGKDQLNCSYDNCYARKMACSEWLDKKCNFTTFAADEVNDLTLIFEKISTLIKLQAQAWKLTDPMGEYINCVTEFGNEDFNQGITFDRSENEINWDLKKATPVETGDDTTGKTYTYNLNYRIKLDNLAADFTPETFYPANDVTSLTYLITGSSGSTCGEPSLKTAYFNIPSVKGLAGNLEFTKADEEILDYVRKISQAYLTRDEKDVNKIIITFVGTGFLRYMVRNMVGLLIEIGEGKRKPEDIIDIFKYEDRRFAGKTAKSCGLYLRNVFY